MNRRGFLGTLAALPLLPTLAAKRAPIPLPAPPPLWLQISFPRSIQYSEWWDADFDDARLRLIAEWHSRELRAGHVLTSVRLPLPRPESWVNGRTQRYGRFHIRICDAFDVVRYRYLTRLDIATAEGLSANQGTALALFVTG